ncbi:uncharacterized protein SCHCODRAFT_02666771 [Schizophyllum commune H4-8]|uniref:Uncharacterized protein n=1 Tax=Schizophyllum commune (strain H4-8 / FGSC 9210) TaxID=578458 RepID=D8PQX6_SCHCM|nr:uncharacterized protein SCHCODRAFT_02666771 [Schizophyllum commune H4-8]KAI5893687.1 hypothetical protein SCHCODRAFT_02666771 [Schizophyllum commune H4-8]
MLCGWLNNGNTLKTPSELNTLVHEVLRHPHFRFEDLKGFDAQIANRRADEADKQAGTPFGTGFRERAVTIDVPSGDKTVPPERIEVPGLHYRRIMDVLREALQDPVLSPKYHLFPFRLFRRAGDSNEASRIYSEIYNSDAMLEAHEDVQSAHLPPEEQECKRPRIVSALMAWSDSTHLANFGNAHVWPIYLMLGNLSKYIRCQPTSGACLHLAYIPSLSAETKRKIAAFHAKWDTQQKQILTHCKRELMQAVWAILLEDDEFLKAYRYGFVMEINGTEYRVYPRLFTYSADYPEKVLLATIRDKGICVCPRCLMPRDKLECMGMVSDMKYRLTHARTYLKWAVERARNLIYNMATPITGPAVERLLKATSSVPTKNAFKIDELDNIDVSRFLVVDFMHEFELGVWKAFFTHSIRLLYAIDSALVKELNKR